MAMLAEYGAGVIPGYVGELNRSISQVVVARAEVLEYGSFKELADDLGIYPQVLDFLRKGLQFWTLPLLVAVADTLKTTVADLVREAEEMTPSRVEVA